MSPDMKVFICALIAAAFYFGMIYGMSKVTECPKIEGVEYKESSDHKGSIHCFYIVNYQRKNGRIGS